MFSEVASVECATCPLSLVPSSEVEPEDEEEELEEQAEEEEEEGEEGEEGGEELGELDEDEQEEEAWLDALETGKVDERGYLPHKRELNALTARQVKGGTQEDIELFSLSLPPESNARWRGGWHS